LGEIKTDILNKSKLVSDLATLLSFVKNGLFSTVKGFKLALVVMVLVFAIRAIVGGNLIPNAIANIVNAVKNNDYSAWSKLWIGIEIFVIAGILYIATEFMLYRYFLKLAEGIVELKKIVLERIIYRKYGDNPEDLVGKISSDIDFVVWNVNAVLTTFIPNLFTGISSAFTVLNFDKSIGIVAIITLLPYIALAEYYSRKVEPIRLEERRSYSLSITAIRDAVYGIQNGNRITNILSSWRKAMGSVMWYDRLFWGLGLIVQPLSISLIAYLSVASIFREAIDAGTIAGILSASLGAHSAMINAVWALCIESQTVAAIKRISSYLIDIDDKKHTTLIITRYRT